MRGTARRAAGVLLVALSFVTASPTAAHAGERGIGTDDRRWVGGAGAAPASMSPASYPVTALPVEVPTRDGTTLTAVLYQPVGLPASAPKACVLFDEGYVMPSVAGALTTPLITPRLIDLARRGYAGLYVNLRGRTVTPVADGLYYRYAEDGYDAIEWAAAQPWCDSVGMIGGSLDGITTWLPASLRPPHLKAIAPEISCGDCYWYVWNRGGTLPGAGRMARKPPSTATDEYAAASTHRTYDAWWEARNTTMAEHRAMSRAGIAVMQCGGWNDYITPGGMRAIEELTSAGGHGLNIVGPCSHGASTQNALVGQVLPDPKLVPYDYNTFVTLWFDRWLKGIRNGFETQAQGLIYVRGADQYRYEQTWPPTDTHWTTLSLRATRSGTIRSLNDGALSTLAASAGERAVSYLHDPAGYLNNAGGGGAPPSADQRTDEQHGLTWTSAPLSVPTELTGWPKLRLYASSTAVDTDFVAEITDVAPDGTAMNVFRGWLNAPQSFSRSHPRHLVPGKVYRYDMELWPQSYVLPKGHRLRVSLAGADFPGTGVNPHKGRVTVYQDAAHPSAVLLPVIGTGWKQLEKAATASTPAKGAPRGGSPLAATGSSATLPALAGVVLLLGLAVRRRPIR